MFFNARIPVEAGLEPMAVRVRRGAKWLDEAEPGWARRVRVAELDMIECDRCVLGQLYGNFWSRLRETGRSWYWAPLHTDF